MKSGKRNTLRTLAMIAVIVAFSVGIVSADTPFDEYIVICDYSGSIFYIGQDMSNPEFVDELDSMMIYGLGMGDFDGDGDYDFVIGDRQSNDLWYYEKLGEGNDFAERVSLGSYDGVPMDFAVADYNSDGNYDFIFTNFMETAYMYLGRGDGTFDVMSFPVPPNCLAADSGDFNGDGNADIVFQKFDANHGDIYLFFGDGAGYFTQTTLVSEPVQHSFGLTAGDFDGDGYFDLLTSARGETTVFYLFRGFGDGTFTEAELVMDLGFADYTPMDNYDFDEDGNMDFVFAANGACEVYVFLGVGDAQFVGSELNPISIPADNPLLGVATPPCMEIDTNEAPVAEAGDDQDLAADDEGLATVELDGSGSSDPDEDVLSYKWSVNGEEFEGAVVSVELPVGEYEAALTVSDGELEASDTVKIVVRDVTPPTISISVDPEWLWPANHKMIEVFPEVEAEDNLGGEVEVELVDVVSNQPADARGFWDGWTREDVRIDGDRIFLRAERDRSKREARVYTITYKAVDEAGNEAFGKAEVVVPTLKMVIMKLIEDAKKKIKEKKVKKARKVKKFKRHFKSRRCRYRRR